MGQLTKHDKTRKQVRRDKTYYKGQKNRGETIHNARHKTMKRRHEKKRYKQYKSSWKHMKRD